MVGHAALGNGADGPLTELTGNQVTPLAEPDRGMHSAGECKDLTYPVGPSLVHVRLYLQSRHGAEGSGPRVTHAAVLLPPLAGGQPQRVMLHNEHWKMVAQVLLRQRPAATVTASPADRPIPPAKPDADSPGQRKAPLMLPPIGKGTGARLYLLDHHKLYKWASIHWKSLTEIEAVCDAFFHNWKSWRLKYHDDWCVADYFFACQKRLNTLRRRAARVQDDLPNEPAPSAVPDDGPQPTADVVDECLPYARLLEDVLIAWNDRDALAARREQLREMLWQGASTFPADLRPWLILELIEMRLHAMLPRIAIASEQNKRVSTRAAPAKDPSPSRAEWPAEAEQPAAVALNSEAFFHATGMLKFMGYSVGRKAALSARRRRAILQYVFTGRLPPVNDALYMQEWARPRSNRRLRKIANSLATFARNARKKKSSSWNRAIANWEADLAYLKRRYYDKRNRDWKWPDVVRKRSR
jgi:hypothetical protein